MIIVNIIILIISTSIIRIIITTITITVIVIIIWKHGKSNEGVAGADTRSWCGLLGQCDCRYPVYVAHSFPLCGAT
jgi:hypothetical protein